MEAVVLAAGKGERLKPFCRSKPKPLIKILDKPILSYVIRALVKNNIRRIVFVLGHMQEVLSKFIKEESEVLDFKFEICIQRKLLGTGDALKEASKLIKGDKFLTVYGDLYFNPSIIRELIHFSEKKGFDTCLALVKKKEIGQFGLVEVNGEKVKRILEKPRERGEGLINTGIYLFNRRIIEELSDVKLSERGEYELTDAITSLASKSLIGFIKISGSDWLDIGRPWDILEACRLELKKRTFKIPFVKGSRIIPPVYIDSTARIGYGCVIGPYVSIGKNVEINGECIIKRTVVMDCSRIGSKSKISHSVIGEGCVLGSRVYTKTRLRKPVLIKTDGRKMFVKSRRIGAFIGDYATVPNFRNLSPAEVIF